MPLENEMLECCLKVPCEVVGNEPWGNKNRAFSCDSKAGFFRLGTLQEDQICGISKEGKEIFRPYFLTVPERSFSQKAEKRRVFFKGKISLGAKTTDVLMPVLASYEVATGRGTMKFHEGSCQLVWDGKPLTTGLGIYTSLFSKGVWYDSTQARWKIRTSSQDQLVVEGFWPWIPISQVWEILLKNEKTVLLNVQMKVFREIPIHMQETVMMMSVEYEKWSAGKEAQRFPEGFTSDDFFRFCLWAHEADGISSLASHSRHLPTVTFKPASMPGHRIIVENSAHIYDMQSRLFHCLRVNKKEETFFEPGGYEFFKGLINIKEDRA